jgi:hypothetical protein
MPFQYLPPFAKVGWIGIAVHQPNIFGRLGLALSSQCQQFKLSFVIEESEKKVGELARPSFRRKHSYLLRFGEVHTVKDSLGSRRVTFSLSTCRELLLSSPLKPIVLTDLQRSTR